MSGIRPRVVLGGLLAAALGGLLAVGVAAHTTQTASTVGITGGVNDDYVYGAVSSQKAKCAPKRKVRLYRERAGDDKLVDETSSLDPSGAYTIEAATGTFPTGTYYSKARKRDLDPGPQHSHICQGAKSDKIPIEP